MTIRASVKKPMIGTLSCHLLIGFGCEQITEMTWMPCGIIQGLTAEIAG